MMKTKILILILCVMSLGCAKLQDSPIGKEDEGTISGTVSSESSLSYSVALYEDIVNDPLRTTSTVDNGRYVFLDVPEGAYTIVVIVEGDENIMREPILVYSDEVTILEPISL